jgi:hypothetical protein
MRVGFPDDEENGVQANVTAVGENRNITFDGRPWAVR